MACAAQKRLSDLLRGWVDVPAGLDCWIGNIQQDSRLIKGGDLFIASEGLRSQGTEYIEDAIARGARAVVLPGSEGQVYEKSNVVFVELEEVRPVTGVIAHRFFGQVTAGMTVIGVTGTNGKSSVTHYIAELARSTGVQAAVIGTLGVGVPGQLQAATHTTPDAVTVHRQLAELFEQGIRLVAMEVSSHALDQLRVGGIRFAAAVFTNLTRDHLDYHGTMEAYAEAKRSLLEMPGVLKVINVDDPTGRRWEQELSPSGLYTFATESGQRATVRAAESIFSETGMAFSLLSPQGEYPVHAALIGSFNQSNLLAALTCLMALGYSLEILTQQAESLTPVPGRMEPVQTASVQDNTPAVIVDYAHTPDALSVALKALRLHCRGKLWCVFGCGGDRDPGKRPLMGEIAEAFADCLVITDDNPRTEDPGLIVRDILAGLAQPEQATVVQPREKAIEYALEHAQAGDLVLLAGKGHEDYQEIHGQRTVFSDIGTARTLLERRGGGESSSVSVQTPLAGGWQ